MDVQKGHVGPVELWDFCEGVTKLISDDTKGMGVRAVVSLNSEVTVDASGGDSIKIKIGI